MKTCKKITPPPPPENQKNQNVIPIELGSNHKSQTTRTNVLQQIPNNYRVLQDRHS
jgi:hypothetical protein